MYLPFWASCVFGVLALAFSLFYALVALSIFTSGEALSGPKLWHQRWFNFAGSVAGWAALYCVIAKIHRCFATQCAADFGLGDLLACFVAFVGVTGHLPYAAMGAVQGIRELAKKVPGIG